MQRDGGAIRVVAGCLFEVVLTTEPTPSGWRWTGDSQEVTLLAEGERDGQHRFRFRAEAAGAAAGTVVLRFEGDEGVMRSLAVEVAAERWPGS